MRIQLGEQILTTDGLEAGRVDKVILDPSGGVVNSVVLRREAIFPHDVEVTVDRITEDAAGHHRLSLGSERLEDLEPFDESKYTTPPADLTLLGNNSVDGVLWPVGYAVAPTPVETTPFGGDREIAQELGPWLSEQDIDNAVIVSGSAIMSSDDKKIGELARLAFSDTDGHLESLVVRQGFLMPTELELSGSLVESADDGILYLNVDSEFIKELASGH